MKCDGKSSKAPEICSKKVHNSCHDLAKHMYVQSNTRQTAYDGHEGIANLQTN